MYQYKYVLAILRYIVHTTEGGDAITPAHIFLPMLISSGESHNNKCFSIKFVAHQA